MKATASTTIMVNVRDAAVSGSFRVGEHEYSEGPYGVVTLKLGKIEIVIFPEDRHVELAQILTRVAADLVAFNAAEFARSRPSALVAERDLPGG